MQADHAGGLMAGDKSAYPNASASDVVANN